MAFAPAGISANLSTSVREFLETLGLTNLDSEETAGLVWFHSLAIGFSLAYLVENADGIRQDWPRIPLPADKAALLASAELGRKVAALLDPDTTVPGVTAGTLPPELRSLALLSPTHARDLSLTAGWGHGGKGGVTMPGKGKVVKREQAPGEAFPGEPGGESAGKTLDIYLNDTVHWKNIPPRVWDFTIGGYQVLKKWLSYREHGLLGRPLAREEVRHVQETARRLAALVLLEPELDANYRRVAARTWRRPGK